MFLMINLFSMPLKRYIFHIQCIIFLIQYKFVMAIHGPMVRQAYDNEFPGLASIMSVNDLDITEIEWNHQCTGTLISRQDVLTAEHCLQDTFTEGFKVLIGSIDVRLAIEFFPMFIMSYEHWILYRQRTLQFYDHDICIVKLLANIPRNMVISPIGNIESNLLYGLNAQITGWGRLMDQRKPRYLHTAIVRIMSKRECQHRLLRLDGIHFIIHDRFLCSTGNPYAILGYGDSGGPLIYFGSTIGISSGVLPKYNDTTRPDQINIHLNLQFYNEYIYDVITRFHMSHF